MTKHTKCAILRAKARVTAIQRVYINFFLSITFTAKSWVTLEEAPNGGQINQLRDRNIWLGTSIKDVKNIYLLLSLLLGCSHKQGILKGYFNAVKNQAQKKIRRFGDATFIRDWYFP